MACKISTTDLPPWQFGKVREDGEGKKKRKSSWHPAGLTVLFLLFACLMSSLHFSKVTHVPEMKRVEGYVKEEEREVMKRKKEERKKEKR